MRRGDIVVAAERGRLTTKPRPWLVVQSDAFNEEHQTITLCLISSGVSGADLFRISVAASPANGLQQDSEVMADKLFTLSRGSIQTVVGTIDAESLSRVDAALRRWLEL